MLLLLLLLSIPELLELLRGDTAAAFFAGGANYDGGARGRCHVGGGEGRGRVGVVEARATPPLPQAGSVDRVRAAGARSWDTQRPRGYHGHGHTRPQRPQARPQGATPRAQLGDCVAAVARERAASNPATALLCAPSAHCGAGVRVRLCSRLRERGRGRQREWAGGPQANTSLMGGPRGL